MARSALAVADCTTQPATSRGRPAKQGVTVRAAVRAFFEHHPGQSFRLSQVAEKLGMRRAVAAAACADLVDDRVLLRMSQGVYQLRQEGQDDDPFVAALGALEVEAERERPALQAVPAEEEPAPPAKVAGPVPPLPDVTGMDLRARQIAWCAAAAGGNQRAAALLLGSVTALIWKQIGQASRRRQARRQPLTDEDREDMFAECQIAVATRAVPKFDSSRGFSFVTYALCWIDAAITRWLAMQSRAIHIPVGVTEAAGPLARARRHLRLVLSREPTIEEAAAAGKVPIGRARRLAEAPRVTMSVEEPIGRAGGRSNEHLTILDLVADESPNAEQRLTSEEAERVTHVRQAVEQLPPRERAVIEARMRGHTLEGIGEAVGLTRERIRQIEQKAKRRLRWQLGQLAGSR